MARSAPAGPATRRSEGLPLRLQAWRVLKLSLGYSTARVEIYRFGCTATPARCARMSSSTTTRRVVPHLADRMLGPDSRPDAALSATRNGQAAELIAEECQPRRS